MLEMLESSLNNDSTGFEAFGWKLQNYKMQKTNLVITRARQLRYVLAALKI